MPTSKITSFEIKAENWGNSLGFKINQSMASKLKITEESVFSLSMDKDSNDLILRRIETKQSRVFISEKEIVADLEKNKGHFDELAVILPSEFEH